MSERLTVHLPRVWTKGVLAIVEGFKKEFCSLVVIPTFSLDQRLAAQRVVHLQPAEATQLLANYHGFSKQLIGSLEGFIR